MRQLTNACFRAVQVLALILLISSKGIAIDLIVSGTVQIDTAVTYDNIVVNNDGTLIANGEITSLGKMHIISGGVVSHSSYPTNSGSGLQINVTDSLIVDGDIYVSGYGLRGANGSGSAHGSRGEAYDATGTSVVAGSTGDAGGSYGGIAQGGSNASYGVIENPSHFGSGGSGCRNGGNGGGLATISAGTMVLVGTIQADGTTQGDACAGGGGAGGGSGGGVRIACGTLTGPGSIYARGGNGRNQYPTAGGGGRVAVYYSDISGFDQTHIYVRGGATRPGSAGTIYFKDSTETYGEVVINNGGYNASPTTSFKTGLTSFKKLTVREWGEFSLVSSDVPSFTVEDPVLIASSGRLTLSSGVMMDVTNPTGFDVEVQSSGYLILNNGSVLNANSLRIAGGYVNDYIGLSYPVASDFELSGGALTVIGNSTFSIASFDTTNFKSGSVSIRLGSRMDVAANRLTVGNGVYIYKDGQFGASDTVNTIEVLSGGQLRHHSYPTNNGPGLRVNVTDSLIIDGTIYLTGYGLRGANGSGSAHGSRGEAYDATGTSVVAGSTGDAGGSYGG
ncbi:MAG: hypothetical protein OEV49_17425, partial [candidate division Zixibacteria bacterium]|nr:hypothetical protein [candidate division Zixibacteria bacterium]